MKFVSGIDLSYFSKKGQNDLQYKERESCGRHRAGNSQKPSTAEINEIRLNQLPTVELKKHSLTINGQSLLCGHKQRQGALLIGQDFMTLPWVSLPLNDHIIKDNQRMIRYTDRQGWIEGCRETRG